MNKSFGFTLLALAVVIFASYVTAKYGKPPAVVELVFNYSPIDVNGKYGNHFTFMLMEKGKIIDSGEKHMLDGQANYVPFNLIPGHCYQIDIDVRNQPRNPLDFCPPEGVSHISAKADGSPLVFYH